MAEGYARKGTDSRDKRSTIIYLTPKGRSFERIFQAVSEKLLTEAYRGFTEKEKQ